MKENGQNIWINFSYNFNLYEKRKHMAQRRLFRTINVLNRICSQGGGMPITSSSVPYLLSTSLNSIRGSRRPSVSSTSSQQGIGILQQVGSSMVRQLPPICLNLNGPPPPPPTLSPSLQLPGQRSHWPSVTV